MTSPNRLPEVYYKRRRAAALVVLLLIVVLAIVVMTVKGGRSEDTQASPAAVSNTSEATTPAEATPESAAPTTTSASAEPTSQAPATPVKDTCALQDLEITANSDKPTYGPTDKPTFYMTVRNPTSADCTIDLSKDILHFEVYDMATNRRVWSDVDCNPPEDVRTRTYPAGGDVYYEAQWSRTGSAPNQCKDRPLVPEGSYYLHTLVGNNHSDPHPFTLK